MKFITISIIFHVMASILLKYGALSMDKFGFVEVLTNVFYLLSIFFLFLKAIVWQISLKTFNLNYAYLFTSAYYPIILLVSYLIFDEFISWGNIIGTLLIVTGIVCLTKTKITNA